MWSETLTEKDIKRILSTMRGEETIEFWAQENDAVISHRYGEESKLYLKRPLKYGQISAVAECMKRDPLISEVELNGCQLKDTQIRILASALRHVPTLQRLSLRENRIGPKGAETLAAALSVGNSAIIDLDLENNRLGDAGSTYLANMLPANGALRILRLGFNDIGDSGCIALAAALEKNTHAQLLGMWDRSISEAGYRALSPFAARVEPDPAEQLTHLEELKAHDKERSRHSSEIRRDRATRPVVAGRNP